MLVLLSFLLLFQKHYKHNVFNPFQTSASVMLSCFHILAPYVDTSMINCNLSAIRAMAVWGAWNVMGALRRNILKFI